MDNVYNLLTSNPLPNNNWTYEYVRESNKWVIFWVRGTLFSTKFMINKEMNISKEDIGNYIRYMNRRHNELSMEFIPYIKPSHLTYRT